MVFVAGFFAGDFLAAGFLAAGFFVVVFLAGAFFAVVVVFFAAGFFAGAFLAGDFFAVLGVSFTPAAFASAASWLFLRAARFLCSKFFFTAVSIACWASERALEESSREVSEARKFLIASRIARLVLALRMVAFLADRTRFLAD